MRDYPMITPALRDTIYYPDGQTDAIASETVCPGDHYENAAAQDHSNRAGAGQIQGGLDAILPAQTDTDLPSGVLNEGRAAATNETITLAGIAAENELPGHNWFDDVRLDRARIVKSLNDRSQFQGATFGPQARLSLPASLAPLPHVATRPGLPACGPRANTVDSLADSPPHLPG